MRQYACFLGRLLKRLSHLKGIAPSLEAQDAHLTRLSVGGTALNGPFIQQHLPGLPHIGDMDLHCSVPAKPDANRGRPPAVFNHNAAEQRTGEVVP